MTLLFYVKEQSLSLACKEQPTIIADSKNYLKAQFAFQSSEWKSGKLLYALFTHNGQTYKKILGAENDLKWNECYVAPEVIKEGNFSVSVFCDDLITTNPVSLNVLKSGYTENIVNQKATPTVLEQMNQLMYKYASLCNEIHKDCERIQKEMEDKK